MGEEEREGREEAVVGSEGIKHIVYSKSKVFLQKGYYTEADLLQIIDIMNGKDEALREMMNS